MRVPNNEKYQFSITHCGWPEYLAKGLLAIITEISFRLLREPCGGGVSEMIIIFIKPRAQIVSTHNLVSVWRSIHQHICLLITQ
jgi:hypothetical protein